MEKKITRKKSKIKLSDWYSYWEGLAVVFLALYPLRHIHYGLDLWDTGYNYANYTYAGLEHMDSMWFFSTYLTNIFGHLLTLLPAGDTLLGLNLYTGLIVSILTLAGFLFCTRSLKLSPWTAFLGGFLAESLCWCPTAKLYDYLTYVFLFGAVYFLYQGLVREKGGFLVGAGIFLGVNVFVRFSNLPQVVLILAVWFYGLLEYIEHRKRVKSGEVSDSVSVEGLQTLKRTLLCMAGYFGTVSAILVFLMIWYPTTAYFTAIGRLFAMTDNAADYKSSAMLVGLIRTYVDFLYWPIRLAFFVVIGLMICALGKHLDNKISAKIPVQEIAAGLACLAAVVGVYWLLFAPRESPFTSIYYYSYDPMIRPGILFLIMLYLVCFVRVVTPGLEKGQRLIAVLIVLSVLVSSVGSNNGVYPSLNNLFIGAPYFMGMLGTFLGQKEVRANGSIKSTFVWKGSLLEKGQMLLRTIGIFVVDYTKYIPIKMMAVLLTLMIMVQCGLFGAVFVFAESTGIQDASGEVIGSKVLHSIRMPEEKANDLQGLVNFANLNELAGQEVILYGKIPSISFYLQMPSAFNPWPELDSYGAKYMEKELQGIVERQEKPVVILDTTYSYYYEDGRMFCEGQGVKAGLLDAMDADSKWQRICIYLEEMGYERSFRNRKYTVYQ